ncbi:MAG: SpoIID/LytB domain-containing protein [Solirubrobacterales bacterium]
MLVAASPAAAAFGDRTLKRGSRGDDVRVLQSSLTRLGWSTSADGVYGSATVSNVKRYEKANRLTRDGKVSRAQARRIRRQVGKLGSSSGRWTVSGAGWGHGIGMSQYGAYGMARDGATYDQILAHFYSGTALAEAGNRTVRVLVKPSTSVISFRGATKACGRTLRSSSTYQARRSGSRVVLTSRTGRALRNCASLLRATGGSSVVISDRGTYRGAFEARPAGSSLNGINAVDLESYVKGVVPNEMPASWEPEALKAQAVAARTYALTTQKSGSGWEHYDDTRSQVYRGMSSERASTNEAVEQTPGHIVTYDGKPAVTYFHSTSGGRTENVEHAWTGSASKPWLRSVRDPGDRLSPYHRWKVTFSQATIERKLGSLVKGSLREIKITKKGVSPRIVNALVVGSRGSVRTTGAVLRARLGLRDTWASFTKVTSSTSTVLASAIGLKAIKGTVTGNVDSADLQRRRGGRWVTDRELSLDKAGRFTTLVGKGTYRVLTDNRVAGPTVRVR